MVFTASNGVNDNNGNFSDAKANWNACNVAFLLGKQKVYKNNVSFEVYIGPALVGGVLDITKRNRNAFTFSGTGTGINTGITLRAGIALGFAF